MMDDLIQKTIEEGDEGFYFKCSNCVISGKYRFTNGFYCTGIIKYPDKVTPFDVIRFCDARNENKYIDTMDLSPDEALTKASLLTSAVNSWLDTKKTYKKFRNEL